MALTIRFKVNDNINADRIAEKFVSPTLKNYANCRLYAFYYDYVPFMEGFLAGNVSITDDCIEHLMPYSHYQYTGEGFNFRKDAHPLAAANWDKAAMAAKGDLLTQDIENAIKHGVGYMESVIRQTNADIQRRIADAEKRKKESEGNGG